MKRWIFPFALVASVGCEAGYSDFRVAPSDLGGGGQTSSAIGAGFVAGGAVQVQASVLGTGQWSGLRSYSAAGSAEVAISDEGTTVLRFSDDFSVSGVPGPFVVLSSRPSIGSSIDPGQGDIEIGPLESNRGAQTYEIPVDAANLPYVWIFCKPFGVEIARAELEER